MSIKTVGNYTFVEKLGQGAYATVYKAHHETNGGDFAVKVISREKISSTKLHQNLEQEISIMKRITHENVVRLFGTFTSKNNIYLVLEYCGGGDLQLFIRKNKRLEEPVARRFLIQLARGLHYLHSEDIIHRDIKPQNLLLSESSSNAVIKFADFGFAKHLHEASMAQTPCGTPLYMAPEIFEMKEYDAKADVWSVGCVLFEMCTGEPPFKGSNHRELYMNIRSKSLRLPSSVTLSPEIIEILTRLLELNPQRRVSLDMLYRVTERLAADHMQPSETSGSSTSSSGVQQQLQQQQSNNSQSTNKNPDIETVSDSAFSSSRPHSSPSPTNTAQDNTGGKTEGIAESSSSRGNRVRSNSAAPVLNSPSSSSSQQQGQLQQGEGASQSTSRRGTGMSTGNISHNTSSSSMTPATATMLVKLANPNPSPGSSPNAGERTLYEHASPSSSPPSSSSGGGRGGSSAVSKALSSAFSSGLETPADRDHHHDNPSHAHDDRTRRSPVHQHGRCSPQESARYRSSSSAGTGCVSGLGGGNKKSTTGYSDAAPNRSSTPPSAFGRDSDDFVMIDEPSSTAYNSSNNMGANATWKTSDQGAISGSGRSSRDKEDRNSSLVQQQQQGSGSLSSAQWYGGSPGSNIAANLYMEAASSSQQLQQQQSSEELQLSQCAHRCQYIASVVTAMTKHADSVVKAILTKYGKTISMEMDREAILGGGKGGKEDGGRDRDRDRDRGGNSRELSPRQRTSSSSSGGDSYNVFSSTPSNLQLEANLQMLSEALCVPFAFYLHAMNYIQDAIQRTVYLKMQQQQLQTDSNQQHQVDSDHHLSVPSAPSSHFLTQLDGLVAGLTQRFDQLMARAEGCQRWIRSDASPPPMAEPLIYQAALKLGQEAAVEELLGNLKLACDHYWDAKLLVECVLLSASEAGDRRVLQGYAKMFLDQFVLCEKSNALLKYDDPGKGRHSIGKSVGSYEKKSSVAHSPGSNSSFESMNSNPPNQTRASNSPLLNH